MTVRNPPGPDAAGTPNASPSISALVTTRGPADTPRPAPSTPQRPSRTASTDNASAAADTSEKGATR